MLGLLLFFFFFFFNDTATTEIYTLSLHDALPIFGDSGDGPSQFIDPTDECVQQAPLAIAEQPNGKTVVAGVACADRVDGNQVSLVMRYDGQLQPDFGVALKIAARGRPSMYGRTVTLRVGINGPARVVARLRALSENTAVRAPLRLLGSSRINGHRVPS